jgi:hypothetical protein
MQPSQFIRRSKPNSQIPKPLASPECILQLPKSLIESAREQVAELIGAARREIIFTSRATESNNAAIHAALKANPHGGTESVPLR